MVLVSDRLERRERQDHLNLVKAVYSKRGPQRLLLPGPWNLNFCMHKVIKFSTYLDVGTLQFTCRQDSTLNLFPKNFELQNRSGVVAA